jgi:hypothetical protein
VYSLSGLQISSKVICEWVLVIIKSGEIGMLEYYIKQSMNQNLSEAERDNYAKMADKMSDKEKAKAIRDRIKDGCQ